MLKAGIFLDLENLSRTGGRGCRYGVIRKLVEAQRAMILRANTYLAIDVAREEADPAYRQGKEEHRVALRRHGFHLVLKEARRYRNDEGVEVVKANADLDLAVDALLQAENLDYVLLGTGDGDFLRLVRALQSKKKQVDVLSFGHTSADLRKEADYHFSGFLVPDLLPIRAGAENVRIGTMHHVDEERGYGYLTVREGLHVNDVRTDVFLHINDFADRGGRAADMEVFKSLKTREALIEFEMVEGREGKPRAVRAVEFVWGPGS